MILKTDLRFASMRECLDYLAHAPPALGACSISTGNPSDSHYGMSYKDAVEAARFGYPPGVPLIKNLSRDILAHIPQEPAFSLRHDHCGALVDIPRFVGGEPEHMLDFEPDLRSRRFVELAISINAHYAIEASTITKRGAAIAALIDYLESRGVRCGLTVTMLDFIQPDRVGDAVFHSIRLKDPEQPLDLDRLAFAVTNVAMLRRIGLGLSERSIVGAKLTNSNYGYPADTPEELIPPGAIYFPRPRTNSEDWSIERVLLLARPLLSDTAG